MKHLHTNILVIGAGPGGLQLGHFLQKAGEDYVLLEAGEGPGTYFRRFPRHRELISINKCYTGSSDPELNLRWDWNSLLTDGPELRLTELTELYYPQADDLVRYLQMFATKSEINVHYGVRVAKIRRPSGATEGFEVETSEGDVYHVARAVVVATGLALPYRPPIPGIEHVEGYEEVSVDPKDFRDQRVLIIGKGNSAFEVSKNLLGTTRLIHMCSPNPVKMAWQTHFVGHLRAINNEFLDTYQLKSQNAVLNAIIDRIEVPPPAGLTRRAGDVEDDWGDARFKVTVAYRQAAGERETLYYDRVIACTGWQFDRSIFDESCMPETTINKSSVGWDHGKFPAMSFGFESINVPNLFFAGAVTAALDYKRTTSAFIHGFRYNSQALYRMLRRRFADEAWPSQTVELLPDALAQAVLDRVNRSSCLWQQFGYLGDVLALEGDGRVQHYADVPLKYVEAGGLGITGDYYTVTLEYGTGHFPDPFAVERVNREDVDNAGKSQFLHPIVRRVGPGGHVKSTHHVMEVLSSNWVGAAYFDPLRRFFQADLMHHP